MLDDNLKEPYSYKFKEGTMLLLELIGGEIYQCSFEYGDPEHLQVLNATLYPQEQIIDGQMLKFYVQEILSITVIGGNYTPEEEEAIKQKPQKIDSVKCYKGLRRKARKFIYMYEINETFYEAIEHIKSLSAVSVIGEGGQFGRKTPVSLLVIGTNIDIYIFDIKQNGEHFFDLGLRDILSDHIMLKIVCNSRMLADSLSVLHDVELDQLFDVQVSDFQLIQRDRGEQLEEMRPLAAIVRAYLSIPTRVALRSQVSPKQIAERPVHTNVKKHIAMNAAYLYILKNIMQTKMKPNYNLFGEYYLRSLREDEVITVEKIKEDFEIPNMFWSLKEELF